jgi:hypothetical protein
MENFMNLTYAKWLRLSIKQLSEPRKLLNVNGIENKSRELKHYTDLLVRTRKTHTTLHFYLSDLGEQKAILGYPWFAAIQPNIDWKRGWIDHTQLPIILWADNAKWARFIPRQRNIPRTKGPSAYFIGRVLLHPWAIPAKPILGIPAEFARHRKVFSEEDSQRLPKHTVWDHAIELLPGVPNSLPGQLLPLKQDEIVEAHKFVAEHLKRGKSVSRGAPMLPTSSLSRKRMESCAWYKTIDL